MAASFESVKFRAGIEGMMSILLKFYLSLTIYVILIQINFLNISNTDFNVKIIDKFKFILRSKKLILLENLTTVH